MYFTGPSEEPPLFSASRHTRFAQFLLLPAGEQSPCTWADGAWDNMKPNCNYSEKKKKMSFSGVLAIEKNKREENPCSKWKVRWWKQICCTRAVKFPGQRLDLRYHLYWNHKGYQMRVPCLRHPQSEMSSVFKSCLIRDKWNRSLKLEAFSLSFSGTASPFLLIYAG